MKKRDIKIGKSYAISAGVYDMFGMPRAPRGTILADLDGGEWTVHFDQPMYNPSHGYLRPVESTDGYNPHHIHQDCTVCSRDIFGPWDKYTEDYKKEQNRLRQFQEQLERAQQDAGRAIADFERLLEQKEQEEMCIDARTFPLPNVPEVGVRLAISPELLKEISEALRSYQKPTEPSAVSDLLFSDMDKE